MVARDRMLDNGLSALVSESDSVYLCSADPTAFSDIATSAVALKSGSRGSMFYAIQSPPGGGRMASLAGFNDGNITNDGNANYIVVADSVLQNILISELLVAPQLVIHGGKFAVNAMDIVLGRSAQPQPASLTVASPVIDVPTLIPSGYALIAPSLIPSSPAIGSPVLITATSGWFNTPTAQQVGTFVCEFDAVPSAQALDCAVGLSDVTAANYPDMATIVLFTTGNIFQARNGGAYAAVNSLSYTAGISYHVRMVVNVAAHTYSVFITPANTGVETTIATNYAFRTEKNTVTNLDMFVIGTGSVGTVTISNLSVGSLPAANLTVSSPVLATPLLNNKVGLVAFNFTSSSPVLGTPTAVIAGGYNNLTAWPDATNRPQYAAGVLTWIGPVAGGASTSNDVQQSIVLTTSTGDRTYSTANQTISGLDISGTVFITASNITLRRCRISDNGTSVIDVSSGVTGTVIEDCLIDGLGTQTFTNGGFGVRHLGSGQFTLRRNAITRVGNAFSPGSSGPTLIKDNYVYGLLSGGNPHYDVIQMDGVNDQITIDHNNLINDFGQTSVIMMDNFWGPVTNVTINNNRLIGGGYTIYDNSLTPANVSNSGNVITNNRIGIGGYNYTSFGPADPVFTGNVDDITGLPIVPPTMADGNFTIPLSSPVGTVVGVMSVSGMVPSSPLYWHPSNVPTNGTSNYFSVSNGTVSVAVTPPAGTYQFYLEVDNDNNQTVVAYVNVIVSNSTSTVKNLIATALAASSPVLVSATMNNKVTFAVSAFVTSRPALGQPVFTINSSGGYDNLGNWPSTSNRPTFSGSTLSWIGPVGGGPSTSSDTPQTLVLTNSSGDRTYSTNGQVIQGLNITGIVRISGSNITMRRCRISGGGFYTFSVDGGVSGFTMEDCVIVGPGSGTTLYTGNTGTAGLLGSAATFRRCYVYNSAQCISVGWGPVTVIDSLFMADLSADGTHAECIQYNGGSIGQQNYTHNVMRNTINQSFCVDITDVYGPPTNVLLDNNIFGGAASSGVVALNNSNSPGSPAVNVIMTNNFLNRAPSSAGYFYPSNWTCNTYHNNRDEITNAVITSPTGQT